jgi:hypothetical protein
MTPKLHSASDACQLVFGRSGNHELHEPHENTEPQKITWTPCSFVRWVPDKVACFQTHFAGTRFPALRDRAARTDAFGIGFHEGEGGAAVEAGKHYDVEMDCAAVAHGKLDACQPSVILASPQKGEMTTRE